MIRPATISDMPRLLELVMQMHEASEYPKREIAVSEPSAKAVLRDALARNGRMNDGGTLLNVVERKGRVEGFMIGVLQRIYGIGNRLEAQDYWLFCSPAAPRAASRRLLQAYVDWATGNPKVADVVLSWTDVAGVDGETIGKVYKRLGFERRGEIWKRAES